ncbi:MAG: hypothetical protein KDK90_26525 [Leptospiraceae bacterium]|nr:hypothetical protein [Leptospiraceae bacterium]
MGYINYYSKHAVRHYGWLPASKNFQKKYKKKKIKYFTLCDIDAIDIFMFEKEGILLRNRNKFLEDVVICESDEEKVQKIFESVRPPLINAIFQEKIQTLLNFKDDKQTQGLDLNDPKSDQVNRNIRKKLLLKDKALRLQNLFPFDIINFDAYDNIFYPDRSIFKAIEKIFEFQKDINNFLLFLNTPIDKIPPDMEVMFKNDFKSNLSSHPEIEKVSLQVLYTNDFEQIQNIMQKISIGLGKSIVAKQAKKYNWKTFHHGIYIYENDQNRKLLSAVVEVTKSRDAEDASWYIDDVINIIQTMPTDYYSYQDSINNKEIVKDLEEIIDYRNKIQREYENVS